MSPGRYEPAQEPSSKLSSCYNSRRVCAVGPSSAVCSTEPAHLHDTAGTFEGRPASSPLPDPPKLLGFRAYGLSLAVRIVGTRGTFGAFLASTLQLSQDLPPGPAQALFPLPAPFPGCFQHIPSAKSSRVRSRLAVRRVAHVAVMACNFLFPGMLPPPLQLLRRRPNRSQTKAIRYVVSLCRACGAVEPFAVSSAGRRSANLHSGLTGLSELLTWVGPGTDPYGPLFHGAAPGSSATTGPLDPTSSSQPPVPTDRSEDGPAKRQPTTSSPLRPYSSLNAERLKITGRGHWDPVPFLDGEPDLAIACLEPDVLLYGGSPPLSEVPSLDREDPAQVAALARKWDGNNLLFLKEDYGDQVSPGDAVRMFNCYKNEVSDRQIGDRRSRNFRERALKGPSVGLPCGPALLGLALDPKTSTCRVCVTDRKDFYHQLYVRPRKAVHNALFPPIPESELAGTSALALLHQKRAAKASARGRLGEPGVGSLLVPDTTERQVVACFQAICQGDHLGVEIATAAHRCLLKRAGLLAEGHEVRSNELFPEGELLEGLVIDDFYSISIEDTRLAPDRAASCVSLQRASDAYSSLSLLGSTEKDIKGADKAKVAGVEIDSSPETRALGLVTAGAPCAKRLALASLTLSLAALPKTTDALHSCLLGGWVSALLYRRPLMISVWPLGSSRRVLWILRIPG